jgi:hypothetical protein
VLIVDTSVFVDFLRDGDQALARELSAAQVLAHPFVIGEIALGSLKNRAEILNLLMSLPKPVVASDDETLAFIERYNLYGRGVGYVDAHLLSSSRLSGCRLWTRDKKLKVAAEGLSVASGLA